MRDDGEERLSPLHGAHQTLATPRDSSRRLVDTYPYGYMLCD